MRQASVILAHASAPGWSDRAIIRAAGAGCPSLLKRVLCGRTPFVRGTRPCRLTLGDGKTLACLVARYRSPASYTGEDSFELLIPGNALLVDRVIQRLIEAGAGDVRLATPGEFSARAYLNGRLELNQAEGVAALVAARTREQADAARRLLEGTRGAEFRAWCDEVVRLLALVEAGIDFTDQEDVVPISREDLDARLGRVESALRAAAGEGAQLPRSGVPVVALAGRPNAGKSTLFNSLLGRRRAVTSAAAGTTRDVLREVLDLSREVPGAGTVELLDLPGLDATGSSPSERAAQEGARAALAGADVVVHCDPAGVFSPLGLPPAATVIRVQTKADIAAFGPAAGGGEALAVCALDGWHLGPLRRALADATAGGPGAAAQDAMLIPRHRRAALDGVEAIAAARALCQGPSTFDAALVAESLRRASESLGDMAGRVSPDDVLGRIFSTFCIGK